MVAGAAGVLHAPGNPIPVEQDAVPHRPDIVCVQSPNLAEVVRYTAGLRRPRDAVPLEDHTVDADRPDRVRSGAPDAEERQLRAARLLRPPGAVPFENRTPVADAPDIVGADAPHAVQHICGRAFDTLPSCTVPAQDDAEGADGPGMGAVPPPAVADIACLGDGIGDPLRTVPTQQATLGVRAVDFPSGQPDIGAIRCPTAIVIDLVQRCAGAGIGPRIAVPAAHECTQPLVWEICHPGDVHIVGGRAPDHQSGVQLVLGMQLPCGAVPVKDVAPPTDKPDIRRRGAPHRCQVHGFARVLRMVGRPVPASAIPLRCPVVLIHPHCVGAPSPDITDVAIRKRPLIPLILPADAIPSGGNRVSPVRAHRPDISAIGSPDAVDLAHRGAVDRAPGDAVPVVQGVARVHRAIGARVGVCPGPDVVGGRAPDHLEVTLNPGGLPAPCHTVPAEGDAVVAHGPRVARVTRPHCVQGGGHAALLHLPGRTIPEADHAAIAHHPDVAGVETPDAPQRCRRLAVLPAPGCTIPEENRTSVTDRPDMGGVGAPHVVEGVALRQRTVPDPVAAAGGYALGLRCGRTGAQKPEEQQHTGGNKEKAAAQP